MVFKENTIRKDPFKNRADITRRERGERFYIVYGNAAADASIVCGIQQELLAALQGLLIHQQAQDLPKRAFFIIDQRGVDGADPFDHLRQLFRQNQLSRRIAAAGLVDKQAADILVLWTEQIDAQNGILLQIQCKSAMDIHIHLVFPQVRKECLRIQSSAYRRERRFRLPALPGCGSHQLKGAVQHEDRPSQDRSRLRQYLLHRGRPQKQRQRFALPTGKRLIDPPNSLIYLEEIHLFPDHQHHRVFLVIIKHAAVADTDHHHVFSDRRPPGQMLRGGQIYVVGQKTLGVVHIQLRGQKRQFPISASKHLYRIGFFQPIVKDIRIELHCSSPPVQIIAQGFKKSNGSPLIFAG